MSEAKPLIAGLQAPDAEIELSAQDLLELAGPCDNNSRKPEPSAAKTAAASAPPTTRQKRSSSRVAAAAVCAAGAVGVLLFVLASNDATPSLARVPSSELPAAAPKDEGEPVRFANPFDDKEVFEFPAGTSDVEARDAVAEILMARAMERQRQYDARVSSNR